MPKIAVIGGGISGLAYAYRLVELKRSANADIEIFLFEAGSRLGGTIETEVRDGFILEKGPDAFISEKPAALDLSRRLGIDPQVIGTQENNRQSFVLQNNKLIPVPQGFYLIAPTNIPEFLKTQLFSVPGKLRIMLEPLIPRRTSDEDESVGSFIRRRLGKECLDRVAQAMLAGIYTGDPDKLSLKCTVPRFLELEKQYGSIIRGLLETQKKRKTNTQAASGARYSLFLSYRNGMEELTKGIVKKLSTVSIRLNSRIKELDFDVSAKQWRLSLASGEMRMMDAICLALPAFATADLLEKMEPSAASTLKDIPYESVSTINFAYKKEQINDPLAGFGFVAPAKENSPLIAVSFSSQKFENRAPSGSVLLRAFVGGAFGKKFWEMNDRDLESNAKRELSKILGISGEPVFSLFSRYPRAMIQYVPGHLERMVKVKESLNKYKNLSCIGPAFGAVGIPDCIRESEEAAGQIFKSIIPER